MEAVELRMTARQLVGRGKGILAADESTGTISARFAAVGLESTKETRRAYRDMLFTAPGMEQYISGVILYDETLRQSGLNGMAFPEYLSAKGVLPGIKVDGGTCDLALFRGELITQGLDGLRERLAEYRELGARFAKWRAVINIGPAVPSPAALEANAHALARYAALCQEAGMVPIVEPEVMMKGDHPIERCEEVTQACLELVFGQLLGHRVLLEGMLLKPNMVLPGASCPRQAGPRRVAEVTLRCFRRVVPAAVPGIVFLSGGQAPKPATENLNAMNVQGEQPWELSFSYGRALQEPPLDVWRKGPEHLQEAQQAFLHRAHMNSLAREGEYREELEAG